MDYAKTLNLEKPAGSNLGHRRNSLFWWLMNRPIPPGIIIPQRGQFSLRGRELICLARYQTSSSGFKAVAREQCVGASGVRRLLRSLGLMTSPKARALCFKNRYTPEERSKQRLGKKLRLWDLDSSQAARAEINLASGFHLLLARVRKGPYENRKAAEQRAWINANRDRVRFLQRRWQRLPENGLISNLRTRVRQLARRGKATNAHNNELIGCSPKFFVAYLSTRMRLGMTWENYGTEWVIDHVKPCAHFDLTKPREVKKCFHYTNLQPLGTKDNGAKRDKIPRQGTLAI